MNHEGMDHGGMGHGGMSHDMPGGECKMNMLFNIDRTGVCVLHPAFRIDSSASLLTYMLAIFLLAIAYERLRLVAQSHDRHLRLSALASQRRRASPPPPTDADSLLAYPARTLQLDNSAKLTRSALYTLNVGLSFVLMLIVMTYNFYLIVAVLAGAFIGHYAYHSALSAIEGDDDKGMACH